MSLDRVAALSKERYAMSIAPGDPLPPDGQDSSPEFFLQGKGNVRYVVVEGDAGVVCLIAQSFDGHKVRRLWKLPTRRKGPNEKALSGSLAAALFDRGFVPARKPGRQVAQVLSNRAGLAGYYFSVPAGNIYAWFVDSYGKVHAKQPAPWEGERTYPVTQEERRSLSW